MTSNSLRACLFASSAAGLTMLATTALASSPDTADRSSAPSSSQAANDPNVPVATAPSNRPFVIAQAATGHAASTANANASDQLEQVTVTATRQVSTINRVPLSMAAVTQATLDQQGVQNVADLSRHVPEVTYTPATAGAAQIAVRGITTGASGAATTGVYLDDTPLQKRLVNGGASSANGTPLPPLFDVERVEVLRGPQGTLYGGSSEGGTIRMITPQPSLTTYSVYARTSYSATDGGGPSYQGGIAVGGPIVQDKLGFRASIFSGHTGGYVDLVNPYQNGAMVDNNSNSVNTTVGRVALSWAPTERSLLTASYYSSEVKDAGGPDQWLLPQPAGQTYTTAPQCYNTTTAPVLGGTPPRSTCPTGSLPAGVFERPAVTYGPYNYLNTPFQSFNQRLQPQSTPLEIYNITGDYGFDWFDAKEILSYTKDKNATNQGANANATIASNQSTTLYPNSTGFFLYSPVPDNTHWIPGDYVRWDLTEELRLSSKPNSGRLSWVAGLYYSHDGGHQLYQQIFDPNFYPTFFGRPTVTATFGLPYDPSLLVPLIQRYQTTKDVEEAAYGDVTYSLTDKLKLLGGVRVSRVQFSYFQGFDGIFQGTNIPTAANGITNGAEKNTPVTPKFGAEYQLSSNDMIYFTAAKGFRAGGVNSPIATNLCGTALANIGLTVSDIPEGYGPDSIWSYELGEKFRLFDGKVQLNSSVYRINWTQLQLTVPNLGSGCAGGWVQNGGEAISQGFDVDAQARLFGGLTVSASVGYDDAKYADNVSLPTPLNGSAATIIVRGGDKLAVPPWQVSLGAQYDFELASRYHGYVRGDYTYTSSYWTGAEPGDTGYAANSAVAPQVTTINLRAGVAKGPWDLSLFVLNAGNSKDWLSISGGRSACAVATGAACTTFSTYNPFVIVQTPRPREVGLQLTYRY